MTFGMYFTCPSCGKKVQLLDVSHIKGGFTRRLADFYRMASHPPCKVREPYTLVPHRTTKEEA